MRVKSVMTRDVKVCRSTDTLDVPARTMWERDCGWVPAIDDANRVVGIVTDRDICMAAYLQGRPLAHLVVSSVMSTTIHCCRPDDSLEDAEQIMQLYQVRRLPVLNSDGDLLGILSLTDLARWAARKPQGREAGATAAAIEATLAAVSRPRDVHAAVNGTFKA